MESYFLGILSATLCYCVNNLALILFNKEVLSEKYFGPMSTISNEMKRGEGTYRWIEPLVISATIIIRDLDIFGNNTWFLW